MDANRDARAALSVVVICDPNSNRNSAIRCILSDSTEIIVVDSASSNRVLQTTEALLLVAWDSRAAMSVTGWTAFAARRNMVCYGDGADHWPIAKRCEPLLAGARVLLDSAASDFVQLLQDQVLRLACETRARGESARNLSATMRKFGLVGGCEAMQAVFRRLIRFSTLSDLPVLLLGETGTGKEVAARAIHALDPKRHAGPFVPVNCGALNASLIESELFGHRRGAFTGAEEARKGLFRSAHGGTLFLDEIGEMELGLQTKVLRALQECRVLALGEDREVAVDVRVIAASNRNLSELVDARTFRTDLYYRLNVLSLQIPPLRDRRDDIALLVEHFLQQYSTASGGLAPHATAEFVEALESIELRGNVRQLQNLIRHALANREDDTCLDLRNLGPEVWCELAASEGRGAQQAQLQPALRNSNGGDMAGRLQDLLKIYEGNLQQAVDHCEKLLVEAALRQTNGNQAQAARMLGITVRSVYNKLHKHHLNSDK